MTAALACLEVADKIPHPALPAWIAAHFALAFAAAVVVRHGAFRRATIACALAWLACTSLWLGSFLVSPSAIDRGFVEEVGTPYLAIVVLAAALPASAAIASARTRTSAGV